MTRREAIEDAVFAEAEARGRCPIEREESTLAAIYYALGKLAERQGVDMRDVARRAADPESIRPQAYREPSPEEQARLDEEETRQGFAGFLAQAKAALARKQADERTERNA